MHDRAERRTKGFGRWVRGGGLTVLAAASAVAAPAGAGAQPARALSADVRAFVAVASPVVALQHVRVVDGTGAPAKADQTILIRDSLIAAVGDAGTVDVPKEALVLDLTGHTVIPGLVGTHNHTFYTTSGRLTQISYSAPRLYLGSGVTTIRTTGSASPYAELNLKIDIEQGRVPGPRMHVTGPYLQGPGSTGHMHQVTSPEDARRVVAYWAEEGATWIKAYTRISRAELKAAIDEAHARGLRVTGHLCSVTYREAADLGIDQLEHGLFASSDHIAEKQPDTCPGGFAQLADVDVQSPEVRQTIRYLVEKGVPISSTQAIYELEVPNRPPLEERVLEALAPGPRAEYLATREEIARTAGSSRLPEIFRNAQRFEKAFADAGGLLTAGVDPTGIGGALPGFGDQRNYELLIETGFTPVEAIRILTANGARILAEDHRLGSIEPGKLADLAVIEGDPVAEPARIRAVSLVFKDGVGYDARKLVNSVKGQVGIR